VDAQPKASHERARTPARVPSDLPLVLYAIAVGVLIVSAGVLIAEVERLWSPSVVAITLLATATATVIAGVCADSVLGWLGSSRAGRRAPS
jgi:hypothetical protein